MTLLATQSERSVATPLDTTPVGPQQDLSFDLLLNNPLRSLIFLEATQDPGQGNISAEYGRRLLARQDPHQPACPTVRRERIAEGHCATLARAGMLLTDRTVVAGRKTSVYWANPEDLVFKRAVAAASLDWEIQFPHLSIESIVGETRLPSSDRARNLQPRSSMILAWLTVFEALSDSSKGIDSYPQFAALTGRNTNDFASSMSRRLIPKGVIVASAVRRQLDILDSPPLADLPRRKALSRITRATYSTAWLMRREGVETTDAATFADRVSSTYPGVSRVEARKSLSHSPPPNIALKNGEISSDKQKTYRISDQYRLAVGDLVLRCQLLQENPDFGLRAAERANDILTSHEDVSLLLLKTQHGLEIRPHEPNFSTITRRRLESLTLQRLPIARTWRDRAACKDLDKDASPAEPPAVEKFFPIGPGPASLPHIEAVKTICNDCSVRTSCLQWALDTGQQEGIFGGMTAQERKEWRRKPGVKELQLTPSGAKTNGSISKSLDKLARTA